MDKIINLESFSIQIMILCMFYPLLFWVHGEGYLALDSFYHIALAQDIAAGYEGPWLPFTIYENNFPPRHYLFQLILAPFITVYPFAGSVIFVLILMVVFLQVYYLLLKSYSVNYPRLWAFMILISCPLFYMRCIQIRPILIAHILIGCYLLSLKNNKYILIFAVSFLFYLTYTAYLVLLLYSLIFMIVEYTYHTKLNAKAFLFTMSGIIVGYLFHPCFPNNIFIEFNYHYFKLFSNANTIFPVIEWFPLNTLSIINQFWCLYFLFAVLLLSYRNHSLKLDQTLVYFSLNSLLWLLMFCMSARYIDYFYPVFIISFALADSKFETTAPHGNNLNYRKISMTVLLCLSLIYTEYQTLVEYNDIIHVDRLRPSAIWMMNNSNARDIVLTSTPDSFAELYYHNRENIYIHGMDWQYLQAKYPEMAGNIGNVLIGNHKKPSEVIRQYNIRYLFIDLKNYNNDLLQNCYSDKDLMMAYKDNESIVFKIAS